MSTVEDYKMDLEQFQAEAFDKVFEKKPFNFINKYYIIATGDKLYTKKHLQWLDYCFDKYSNYKNNRFTEHESQAHSMLETLDALIETISKKQGDEE